MAEYDFTWEDDFWVTEKHVPFLGETVEITVIPEDGQEARPSPRQLAAIDALDDLPPEILEKIDNAADGHRRRVDDLINLAEEGLGDIQRDNIHEHYEIDEVVIPPHGTSPRIFQFISAECDWEEEHGMEILLCDGKVVSCTNQDCLYLENAWKGYLK